MYKCEVLPSLCLAISSKHEENMHGDKQNICSLWQQFLTCNIQTQNWYIFPLGVYLMWKELDLEMLCFLVSVDKEKLGAGRHSLSSGARIKTMLQIKSLWCLQMQDRFDI